MDLKPEVMQIVTRVVADLAHQTSVPKGLVDAGISHEERILGLELSDGEFEAVRDEINRRLKILFDEMNIGWVGKDR